MKKLVIGLDDKSDALRPSKQGFLLIDDGPICDAFLKEFTRTTVKVFDPHTHSVNPLRNMSVRKARELTQAFYGSEGKDTLTVRNGKRALTKMLLQSEWLDKLKRFEPADKYEEAGIIEALALVDDILLSPILRDVFCRQKNFEIKDRASIVARVDRAKLGDYDAFILGSVLISQFKGQVVIPDFGFFARDFHSSLIRENRLIAGVHTLSELPKELRQMCLLMPKDACQCTYEDAEVLARYEGLSPRTDGYDTYVKQAMGLL